MSRHADTVVDLLNRAKLATDAQEKVFVLEQIKEIFLHRDPSTVSTFVNELLGFVVDRSAQVRKFLVSFLGDITNKYPTHIPAVLSAYNDLVSDSSDSVLRAIASEMTRYYGRIAMSIISMPAVSKSAYYGKAKDAKDPQDFWVSLKGVEAALLNLIAVTRVDNLRLQCIKFAGSCLIFGLPGPGHNNVSQIPLHHGFLNRTEIEEEARALLSKLMIWAKRGGPQDNVFSTEQMIELGIVLCKIAGDRVSEARYICPAVTSIVSSAAAAGGASDAKSPATALMDACVTLSRRKDVEDAVSSGEGGSAVFKKLLESLDAWRAARTARPAGGGAELISSLLLQDEAFSDDEAPEVGSSPAASAQRKRPRPDPNASPSPSTAVAGTAGAVAATTIAPAQAADTLLAEDILPPVPLLDAGPLCSVATSAQDQPAFVETLVSQRTYSGIIQSHLSSVLSAGEHLLGRMKEVRMRHSCAHMLCCCESTQLFRQYSLSFCNSSCVFVCVCVLPGSLSGPASGSRQAGAGAHVRGHQPAARARERARGREGICEREDSLPGDDLRPSRAPGGAPALVSPHLILILRYLHEGV
jgi:hypothetical protein